MTDNFAPFLRQSLIDTFAGAVVVELTDDDRAALLLSKAHLKRIRPVPKPVLEAAVAAYRNGEEGVGIQIQDANDVALVMDKAGDMIWNTLDEAAHREWLLRVV